MNQSSSEFFLQWNTNSLVSHWGQFKNYMLHNKPLVAAIQETHFLDSDSTSYNFNIRDYSLYMDNINQTPRRGGAALYISNKLLHHQIDLQTPLNAVGVKAKIAQLDLTILSVYLTPSRTIAPSDISELFSQIPSPCIIMGDFNAHHMTWGCKNNNTRGNQLLNIMNNHNLIHLSNMIPTFFTTRRGQPIQSVIDLALTTPHTAPMFTQHIADDPLFSDHYPIHYQLETPSGQTNFNFLPRWNFSKADWSSFQHHINTSLSTPPKDINSFLNSILASAHESVPHTRPPGPGHRNTPWWNSECQRAVAIRRRAQRALKRCLCREHEEQARRARFEAREIILKAKTDSWEAFSNNFNRFTPLSKIWSMIKCFSNRPGNTYKIPHLLINNTHYLTPTEVATQFAKHYASISSAEQYSNSLISTLNSKLHPLDFASDNTEPYNLLFTEHELSSAIQKCGNTSVGPDQIAYPFFKNLPENGINTLLRTLNQIWENNSFPPSWRSSTLIPILKPRKLRHDPSSYRPISLTSCASKLFERMINLRLRSHLESNKILIDEQNGFRPGRCTADSLVQIIDSIQRGFQAKKHTLAVFLDLKNAFDKVNKTALLIKIHKAGFRGRMANFIKNFLKDRTFQVRCGNTYSPTFNQDHGLPQGSVISPTLFLIMINDLIENIRDPAVKFSIYADDVAFWTTHHNITEARSIIYSTLLEISNWFNNWGLVISPGKSAALIFNPPRILRDTPRPLSINGINIPYVTEYKYLGVTLDHRLNFNKHFEDITQRCARRINILRCIAGKDWGADRQTLFRLYTSIIRPILDYNGFLFDDIASKKIDSLQTIQNQALRIITGAYCTSPILNIHIEANIPLLDRRRKHALLRFYARASTRPNGPTFKILSKKPTSELRTIEEIRHPTINLRIIKALELFEIPLINTLPAPPVAPYWSPPITIEHLYTHKKETVTSYEAQQLFLEYQTSNPDRFFIYTDGSRSDGRTGVGVATENISIKSTRLNDIHSIFTAELWGIMSAIYYIKTNNIQKAVVCTDSLSALKAIATKRPSANPIVHYIIQTTIRTPNTKFLWIPGHAGIRGNEKADKLAKNSLDLPARNHIASPLEDVNSHIHKQLIKLRQSDWDVNPHFHLHQIKPKIGHFTTSHQNTRNKERILARLRIGHTALTHSYIIERRPPPICHKCNNNTRYTIQHFLLDCPHLHQKRLPITQYLQTHRLQATLLTLLGDEHPDLTDLLL